MFIPRCSVAAAPCCRFIFLLYSFWPSLTCRQSSTRLASTGTYCYYALLDISSQELPAWHVWTEGNHCRSIKLPTSIPVHSFGHGHQDNPDALLAYLTATVNCDVADASGISSVPGCHGFRSMTTWVLAWPTYLQQSILRRVKTASQIGSCGILRRGRGSDLIGVVWV